MVKKHNSPPIHILSRVDKQWQGMASEKAVGLFNINGVISVLNIRNENKVKAGVLLAVIDDLEYKAQLKKDRM